MSMLEYNDPANKTVPNAHRFATGLDVTFLYL